MMMMIEAGIGLLIGVALGVAFFGGLRWTVDRVAATERPGRVLLLSFAVRATLVFVVAALVIQWSLFALLGGAVGFGLTRRVVVGRVRRSLTWS